LIKVELILYTKTRLCCVEDWIRAGVKAGAWSNRAGVKAGAWVGIIAIGDWIRAGVKAGAWVGIIAIGDWIRADHIIV
jgi:hypothetical protein